VRHENDRADIVHSAASSEPRADKVEPQQATDSGPFSAPTDEASSSSGPERETPRLPSLTGGPERIPRFSLVTPWAWGAAVLALVTIVATISALLSARDTTGRENVSSDRGVGFYTRTDWSNANIRQRVFDERTMTSNDFTRAAAADVSMVHADLRGSILTEGNFQGANFTAADLGNAVVISANLIGARLVGAQLNDSTLTSSAAVNADLSSADLSGSTLVDVNLSFSNLSGAILVDADMQSAVLIGADLRNANLTRAVMTDAQLSGACLRGAVLSAAQLTGTRFDGADLRGANLQGAQLTGAMLAGSFYDKTTQWPKGQVPASAPPKDSKKTIPCDSRT
jgi:uncharacterized protein YjbI with pentapeptide repeats